VTVNRAFSEGTMTHLRLKNLAKRFGDVTAVDRVDLDVGSGELVALLGPSGCGKTTTLRMIAGLEQPTAGDILIDGRSVLAIPPERRAIGMVFQRYVLFPHMNVARNIGFGLRMRGMKRSEIDRRVAEVMETVQLSGLQRRYPSQLSGGEQQRVAIARTVVTQPRLLLMDEPLANLDAKLREEMRAFILRLQRTLGITTLFVTHDQTEAVELASKLAVIFDGRIIQAGSPAAVFNRPVNRRVAEFLGGANLIPGRLEPVDASVSRLHTEDAVWLVGRSDHHQPGAAVATVRPEHIALLPMSEGVEGVSGRVIERVYFGGTLVYRVKSGSSEFIIRELSTRTFELGDEVRLTIAPEHLWVLPEG
jgi:putative spermidine/putrescine transport system ATP-binding protein